MSNSFPKIESLDDLLESYSSSGSYAYAVLRMCAADYPAIDGYLLPPGVGWQYAWTTEEPTTLVSRLYGGEPEAPQIMSDLFWVPREYLRFHQARKGEDQPDYKLPTWHHRLPYEGRQKYWYHFVHMSVEADGDRGFVAYTPNPEYGKRDRQIRISVGRYLSKFYREWMSEEDIRAIVNSCKPLELKFGEDEEDFVDAYMAVEDSCMGGMDFDYDIGDLHPAAVYAGTGDFKIACLVPKDAPTFENAQARAVIFRDKYFVRYYGTEANALYTALKGLGYEFQTNNYRGGKLRKIDIGDGRYLMPYVDGTAHYVTDHGDFWVLGEGGEYDTQYTRGFLQAESLCECDACGSRVPEDEVSYSEHEEENYCESCRDYGRDITYAIVNVSGDREWIRDRHAIYVSSVGETYLDDDGLLEEMDLVKVGGEWVPICDTLPTVDGDRVMETDSDYFYAGDDPDDGESRYASFLDIDQDYKLAAYVKPDTQTLVVCRVVHPDLQFDDCTPRAYDPYVSDTASMVLLTIKEAAERYIGLNWTFRGSVCVPPCNPFSYDRSTLACITDEVMRLRDIFEPKPAPAASEPASEPASI